MGDRLGHDAADLPVESASLALYHNPVDCHVIPAVVPPELVIGGVALVVILTLAWWAWSSRKRLGEVIAWLEQAQREQEGRARHDAELQKSSGKLGHRVRERVARRMRKPKR